MIGLCEVNLGACHEGESSELMPALTLGQGVEQDFQRVIRNSTNDKIGILLTVTDFGGAVFAGFHEAPRFRCRSRNSLWPSKLSRADFSSADICSAKPPAVPEAVKRHRKPPGGRVLQGFHEPPPKSVTVRILSHEGNGHGNPTWRHVHAKKSVERRASSHNHRLGHAWRRTSIALRRCQHFCPRSGAFCLFELRIF